MAKIESIEFGNRQIDKFRKEVNNIYIYLVEFYLLGETALDWEDKDLEYYHAQRMVVDGMLCNFKAVYSSHRLVGGKCFVFLDERENIERHLSPVRSMS